MHILMVAMVLFMTIIPPYGSSVGASSDKPVTKGDTPVSFPTVFSPYTLENGSPVLDPAGEIHPIDVDITSGIDKGVGNLSSMQVASDGDNFFVRLRVKGDPYDRKGGFLSSVWLVKLAVDGEHKATIGLNGKSPHYDYVYVADENGRNVQPVYVTETQGGNQVPGTRITQAENGQFFLDFQVPIHRITEMAPEITASTPVQLFFGTSKAANLSVINKEWMDTASNNGNRVDFTGLSKIALNSQPISLEIDGGKSKQYSTQNKVITGTSSVENGTVKVSFNNGTPLNVELKNYTWSTTIPDSIILNNGLHTVRASITSNSKEAHASQDIIVTTNADTLTINGGAVQYTNSATLTLTGTFAGAPRNNYRINLYINDVEVSRNGVTISGNNWSQNVTLTAPSDDKVYKVKAVWIEQGNNGRTFATAYQDLIFKSGEKIEPLSISLNQPSTGIATPNFTGSSKGADEVEIVINGNTTVAIVKPNSDGTWATDALEKPLQVGTHDITAIARNKNGSKAIDTKKHTVSATSITIDNGAQLTINDRKPMLRGNTNAPNNSDVTVIIEGFGTFVTKAQNGRWTVNEAFELPSDGIYNVTAAVNGAIATQQLTVKTETEVEITSPTNNEVIKNVTPIVLGTAEANATIELRLENENHFEMANFTASPNGTWAYAVTEPLLEGTYTVTATASDLYGNEAKEESEFTLKLTRPIEEVAERKIEVVYGTNLAEATQQLGNKIDVTLADTNVVEVSVDWELDSPQTYSGTEPGVYTFTGTLTNLAEINVEKPDHIIVKGEVKVLPGIITSVPKQQVTVPYGTSLESAKTQLNTTVTVNLENGHTYAGVPVQWQDNQAYDSKIPGTYTVTGELHLYQSDAITNLNNVIALAEITVEKANVKQIEDILLTVPFDTNKEEALQQLENKVTIELENGDKVQVDVQWNGVSTPAYDGTKPGAYEFKGTITLPNFVNPESHSNVNGIITVLPKETVSITSVENVEKTIAYETSLEDARKALGDEVVVTLEDGSTATVAITWSSQSHPTYQPDVPGAYVFTGTFGEFVGSIDNWHNIQPPTGTIFVQTVSIESVPNLYKEVKIGTSLPEAIHTLGTEVEVHLSNEKTALIPVTWSEQAIPTYDPATPGVYEFQATFGTLPAHVDNKDGINAPTGTVKILNKEANIVSFSFNEQTGPAIIDGDKKEIHIEVEYGTDVTSLIASYKVSKNVTSVTVASQEQTTNVTSNDYTHGVVYTVVAEDGTVAHWTIFVKVQEKTATPTINEPVRAGDTVVSGTAEPFAVIEVVILDIVIGETTANEDGEWSILATNLSKDDAVKVTAQLQGKVKSDRATTIVESIEATLTLNVTPTTIVADGVQTSTLTAVVKDSKGNVIPNVFVSFEVELGSLSSETAVTDEDGQAIVTLTAPRIESVTSSENVVKVTAVDAKLGIDAEENVVMTYQPPMITGQVLVKNEVIANAAVWIEVDGVKYETVTNENGEYTIFVPKAGEYVVFIKLPDGNGTVFTQKAFVGASSTGETFQAERKITGQLLLESKNVKSLNEMIEGASYQIAVLNDLEGKLAISIDENGIYELTGFDQNEEYDVVISLKVGDISLAGKMFTVFTGKDGQIIIQDELIDPFGIITDVDSGELIEGAVVKLYWADTQLNKDLGRTPHTLVELPILPNFDPNQNKNPQISTEMREYTLEIGNYAWMVFADGDYYITAEKEGYELFDSRNDLATDVVYGDSYIRDGIIHVGQTIVRYDFEMKQTVVVVEEPVVPVEEEEQEVVDPILPEVVTPPTSNEGTSDEVTQPADEETAPANEETKQPADETKAEDEKQTENELPNTATNTYNILLFGLLLISLGGLLLMRFGGRRIVE